MTVLAFIVAINCLNNNLSVNAETKDDVLNTVANFLQAQKNGNVDDMIAYSEHAQQISNVKEFYTMLCKEQPLQKAEITDISIINDNIALVSIESTYKDKIFIGTSPVIKKDGQWKIVKGIPGSGYVEFSTKSNRDKNAEEVEKAIKGYSTALKSGDLTEIKKYIIIPTKTNQDRLEKHFKALSEEPIPEVTAKGIKVISDTFAIVQIEVKHEHFSLTQNHAVGKENGQWKVVFGSTLTNSAIPLSDKPIEIN
jgi:hypothetical protein